MIETKFNSSYDLYILSLGRVFNWGIQDNSIAYNIKITFIVDFSMVIEDAFA